MKEGNLEVHRWIPKGLLEVDLNQILPAVLQGFTFISI